MARFSRRKVSSISRRETRRFVGRMLLQAGEEMENSISEEAGGDVLDIAKKSRRRKAMYGLKKKGGRWKKVAGGFLAIRHLFERRSSCEQGTNLRRRGGQRPEPTYTVKWFRRKGAQRGCKIARTGALTGQAAGSAKETFSAGTGSSRSLLLAGS